MTAPSRPRSALRGVLLFVFGGLLGANGMYYAMTHDIGRQWGLHDGVATKPAPDTAREPAPPAGGSLISRTPTPDNPEAEASLSSGPVLATPAVRANGTGAAPDATSAITGITPTAGSGLLVPVQGISAPQLLDTFSDARSDGRVHDAIDIMAPAGTPVLAVADGTVEKLFQSKLGGTTLYQFNPQRTVAYYYAHLQGYAPGIAEKQTIRRGQLIGYVGSSGNASTEAPHLHFAIFKLGPEQQWWKGTAINPYPQLGGVAR